MVFWAAMSLITALSSYMIGVMVYNRDKRNYVNIMFFVFAVTTSFFGFTEFMMRQSATIEQAVFWSSSISLISLLNAVFLHFVLVYTGGLRKNHILKISCLYLPVFIYFIFIFIKGGYFHDVKLSPAGYVFGTMKGDLSGAIAIMFAMAYSLFSLILLSMYYAVVKEKTEKKNVMYLLIAVIIPIIIGIMQSPVFSDRIIAIPNATSMGTLIMIGIIAFSVFKHNAFDISSETAAKSMITIMQNIFIMTGRDMTIKRVSDSLCRALGVEEKALKDINISFIMHEDSPVKWQVINSLLMSGTPVENIEVLFTYRGKQLPVIFSAAPVRSSPGSAISGYIMSAVDISGRKQLETEIIEALNRLEESNTELTLRREEINTSYEKLKELDLMKQNFISIVSHELRTPLTSIKGFLSFLITGMAGPINEKQKDFLGTISSNTEKLFMLINELLDFSKIESGTFSISRTKADAAAVADKVLEEMSSIAFTRKIRLKKEYTNTGKQGEFDDQRISQVLINLINNSMKFSQPDTVVSVFVDVVEAHALRLPESMKPDELKYKNYILFHIKDQGTGMEQKYADKIFQRFYQIEAPNVRRHEGIGLGLNIAKSIVEAHGGFIWAESEGRGKGSDFYFAIPV